MRSLAPDIIHLDAARDPGGGVAARAPLRGGAAPQHAAGATRRRSTGRQ